MKILSLGLILAVSGFSQSSWTKVSQNPSFRTQNAVIYADRKFVAVGEYGEILVSSNGKDWTMSSVGGTCKLNGIAFGNGAYVAVGNGCIYRSETLENWTQDTKLSSNYFAVAFANNLFVTVGETGTLYTSPNGLDWTLQTTPTTKNLSSIRYLNGLFVVGGWYGTILTSSNGITWNERHSGEPYALNVNDVAYGLNQYIAVGGDGSLFTSPDAVTWTKQTALENRSLNSILFAQDSFAIVGQGSINYTSHDGTVWTKHSNNYGAESMLGLAFGNGIYVAVGTEIFYSGSMIPTRILTPLTMQRSMSWNARQFDLNGRLILNR